MAEGQFGLFFGRGIGKLKPEDRRSFEEDVREQGGALTRIVIAGELGIEVYGLEDKCVVLVS